MTQMTQMGLGRGAWGLGLGAWGLERGRRDGVIGQTAPSIDNQHRNLCHWFFRFGSIRAECQLALSSPNLQGWPAEVPHGGCERIHQGCLPVL
jgi:hypothetical protein